MATILFLLKRFAAQRSLGAAIVVTLGFTIGVLVAGPIYADAAREAILTSETARAAVTVKNVRFTVYAGPGFDVASATAHVEEATAALPLNDVVAQGRGTVRLGTRGGTPVSLDIVFRDGGAEHLPFRGRSPSGPDEVALPEGVAQLLGVGQGDRVAALGPSGESAALTVVGTFDRPPAGSAFWYGRRSPFPPPDSLDLPPALMSSAGYLQTVPGLGVSTEFVWDAYVRYRGLSFEDASRLPSAVSVADRSVREADGALASASTTSGIETMMRIVRQRVDDLRVPIFLVVFQIGAVTLAVLAGVGALVLSRQSFELAVLRSRGFSRGKLLAAQGVQALLSAAVAFPLGLLLGSALAALAASSNGPSLPGVLFPIRISSFAQALGLVGAGLGALALLLLSVPHVRRTIIEERRLLSREERPLLARVPVELFVLPVAVFAFVQLRGSEVRSNVARANLDPLVLLTPTLLIFTLSFVALRLLLFVLRRLDGRVGRARRLAAYLAARRLGRSPGTSFATSLLLVLSVGLLVVSTSYRALVLRNHEDSARQLVGSGWNVQVAAPEQPLAVIDGLPSNVTAVVRTVPSFERSGNFTLTPTLIAVDPETFADGGWWRADYSPTPQEQWLEDLGATDPAVSVDGERLSADVTLDPSGAGLTLVVTYLTSDQRVLSVSTEPLPPGRSSIDVSIADAARLMSIGFLEPEGGRIDADVTVELANVAVGTAPVALAEWEALSWRGSGGELRASGDGVLVAIRPGAGHVLGAIAPIAEPIPALVSPEIARSQGREFDAAVGGQRLAFRGVAIAEHFPSTAGEFVVVSTPALLRAASRIPEAGIGLNEVWSSGGDPRASLERAGLETGAARAAGPIVAALAQLPQSLAVGMNFAAAAGGTGLVVIGVAVGLYAAQRRRAFEFAALRAMGAGPGQIARVVLLEQGLMIVFAVVAGVGIGYGVLRFVMPYVGRSIGSAFPEPVLVVDWLSLGLALAAVTAASAIALAAAIRALVRSSVTSVLRGEAE